MHRRIKKYFCMLIRVHHNELSNRPISNAELSNLVLACTQLKKKSIKRKLRHLKSLLGEKHNTIIINTTFVITAKTCAKKCDKIKQLNKLKKKFPDIYWHKPRLAFAWQHCGCCLQILRCLNLMNSWQSKKVKRNTSREIRLSLLGLQAECKVNFIKLFRN